MTQTMYNKNSESNFNKESLSNQESVFNRETIVYPLSELNRLTPAYMTSDDYLNNVNTTGVIQEERVTNGNLETTTDSDWFKLSLQANEKYVVKVTPDASSGNVVDFIGLYDANGQSYGFSEYTVFGGEDYRVAIIEVSKAGDYFIDISGQRDYAGTYQAELIKTEKDDYANDITTTGVLELNKPVIGNVEVAYEESDWFKVQLQAGKRYQVNLSTDNDSSDLRLDNLYDESGIIVSDDMVLTNRFLGEMYLEPKVSGTYFVATHLFGLFSGQYEINLTEIATKDDYPADISTNGVIIADGAVVRGELDVGLDEDWFKLSLKGGKTYVLESPEFVKAGSYIKSANDDYVSSISQTTKNGRRYSILEVDEDGEYFISVEAYSNKLGKYDLRLKEIQDDFSDNSLTNGEITVGHGVADGVLEYYGDKDKFKIDLEANKTYKIVANFENTDATYFSLRGFNQQDGWMSNFRSSSTDLGQVLELSVEESGTYYIDASSNGVGRYQLSAYEKNSSLIGNNTINRFNGSSNNDWIETFAGNDILVGNAGNDVLDGGADKDTMRGGTGNDTYIVDNIGDKVVELVGQGKDTVVSSVDYTLTENIEVLSLIDDAKSGIGNNLNNVLNGNSYDNTLHGEGGKDTIFAGEGDDTIYGGGARDILWGEAGDDELIGQSGDDILYGGIGNDTLIGISGSDYMHGGKGNDRVYGGGSKDILEGKDGNDYLNGQSGNDILYGGNNHDTLIGAAGNDSLIGGLGRDTLYGGGHRDKFIYQTLEDSSTNVKFRDIIKDFQSGVDLIDLSAIDANANKSGNQAFVLGHNLHFDTTKHLLTADVNGDRIADFALELANVTQVQASDFVL